MNVTRNTVTEVDMDNGVNPEALANEILTEQGFVFKNGKWMKPKAKRTSKIAFGNDPSMNTRLLMKDILDDVDTEINRLLQVLNGKVQRSSVDHNLAPITENGAEYIRQHIGDTVHAVLSQLLAGKRQVTTSDVSGIPL